MNAEYGRILKTMNREFLKVRGVEDKVNEKPDEEWTKAHVYNAMPIENLGLGTRMYNGLRREGIKTVGQIMDRTVAELLDIRNVGLGSLADLIDKMGSLGGDLMLSERVKLLEQQVAELTDRLDRM